MCVSSEILKRSLFKGFLDHPTKSHASGAPAFGFLAPPNLALSKLESVHGARWRSLCLIRTLAGRDGECLRCKRPDHALGALVVGCLSRDTGTPAPTWAARQAGRIIIIIIIIVIIIILRMCQKRRSRQLCCERRSDSKSKRGWGAHILVATERQDLCPSVSKGLSTLALVMGNHLSNTTCLTLLV